MTAGSHLPHAAGYGDAQDRRPFIESHRALAVRTREFERLIDGVVRGASTVRGPAAPGEDVAVVRRAPDRCVVQLGPVALTIAWLRSTIDSVAEGQLLVIVWRGVIAPTGPYAPDRTTALASPVRAATTPGARAPSRTPSARRSPGRTAG